MLRFQGSLNDLQELMMRCVILGEWNFHKKSRFYRFQAAAGAILNWWPKTGSPCSFLNMHSSGRRSQGLPWSVKNLPGQLCPVPHNGGRIPGSPKFCRNRRRRGFASAPCRA